MDLIESQTRRRALREQRRRAARRRLYALLAAIGVVVVGLAIALGSGGANPTGSPAGSAGTAAGRATRARAHRRRHAGHGRRHGSTVTGRPTGVPGTVHAPILMYHVIAPPPPGAPFPGLYVTAQDFQAEMQALKGAGFVAVTQDQLRANWRDGTPLPKGKPIVITFDNGYHSQYAAALPILRAMHWPAVENIQLQGLPPSQGGLTPAEIRAMVNAGWELDTQGISHADLIALTPAQLTYQVQSARATIQRTYHVPVNWFCYPSGHYDAAVIAEVKTAGYVGSTTVVPGWAGPSEDPYALPRLRVLNGTSGPQLLAQIAQNAANAAPGGSYG